MKNDNKISLNEIRELVTNIFLKQGCNQENASALANTITKAEEDGSSSHGLFRLPGYVASLKSGKVNGHASPRVVNKTPHPMYNGNLVKFKFITQVSIAPPKFFIFTNHPKFISNSYKRFLTNNLKNYYYNIKWEFLVIFRI